MRISKRALQSTDFILTIPRMIFTVVAVLTVIYLVNMFLVQEIDIQKTQSKLFFNRLIYSPNTISYVDPNTQRSYPGIIDHKIIDDVGSFRDRIENAIHLGNNRLLAANITIVFEKDDQEIKKSIIFNDMWFKRWEPLSLMSDIEGPGGVDRFDYSRYMLVKEGTSYYPATLAVEVLMSR